MPLYDYRCTSCGRELEVQQSFDDEPLTVCPTCHGKLRKVFAPIAVTFKGSGFYPKPFGSSKPSGGSGSSTKSGPA